VSFLGTAWFASLVAFHVAAWSPLVPGLLLAAVSAGAIGSLFFLGIIVRYRHLCPYCLMVHSANLAAWLLLATAPAYTWPTARTAIGAASGAAVFAAVTAILAWTRTRTKQSSARQREQRFRQSLRRIHQHLHHAPERHLRQPVGGRWWCGPTTAEIRLVVYLDYQCPDCRLAERQLEQALSGRCNVAVTYRHFPLSRQCNPRVHPSNDHRYACRAARAAEAAGLLGGNQGFLRLHAWLFHETVEFSDAELAESLPRLGFADIAAFFATMNGPDVAKNVQQDIEEATRLAVVGTPAVFVEGIRLEGATADQALPRLLNSLLDEREPRTRNANGRQETYRP
jgi:predicted DsbA family dithiol-disulfide isomerase